MPRSERSAVALAAKSGPLGENLGAGATAEPAGAQHLLPGGDGLLEDRGVDLAVQDVIGGGIAIVRDAALAVAQVLGDRKERRAIA